MRIGVLWLYRVLLINDWGMVVDMFGGLKAIWVSYWKHRSARKRAIAITERIIGNPSRHDVKVITKKQVKRKAASVSDKRL